uniref:Uncharacterized protein n=1 Tax=Arundo donax TaxID=35708 RepID=A0A0A9DIH0_ARUDO
MHMIVRPTVRCTWLVKNRSWCNWILLEISCFCFIDKICWGLLLKLSIFYRGARLLYICMIVVATQGLIIIMLVGAILLQLGWWGHRCNLWVNFFEQLK